MESTWMYMEYSGALVVFAAIILSTIYLALASHTKFPYINGLMLVSMRVSSLSCLFFYSCGAMANVMCALDRAK
jgi:hypothetical protein